MNVISLNGTWTLYKAGDTEPIPATVPGQVHLDLLRAGLIEDPYQRSNERDVQWVGETDWTYCCTFTIDGDFLNHKRVLLRFKGLDTLATVTLNGEEIGKTDNMFRVWQLDVRALLQPGENRLDVHFMAPASYGRERQKERFLPNWGDGAYKVPGGNWLRKSQCNFGWDWGPMLATSGIWRDVDLLAFDVARLTDVHIRQDHSVANGVMVNCHLTVEQVAPEPLHATVTLSYRGEAVARQEVDLHEGVGQAALAVANPHLWWPNGMGEQPLYDVEVALLDAGGETLDNVHKRIGLRTLRLVREPDQWGESFYFSANGVPFFAKGANWIPADTFPTRLDGDWYRNLLESAVAANMNMLRVWGGGIYEEDVFYELCDELGLCVWQDFMFACAAYPTFDDEYIATVQEEAEDNVRRLRHHACLALWCGNNELEQGLVRAEWSSHAMSWADYAPLFDHMLPEIVARLDPDTDYWPSSAHSPLGNREDFNNPNWGDAHIWEVWHAKEPFEFYRTCFHRFNSEFGFQSFPEPRSVETYTAPQDRNITSYVMEHHQRHPAGNQTIMHYMLDWFRLPTSFDMTLWLSQILQGMAVKYAVEHWRRTMPRGMGTLYWQLNDTWPVASWSSLDYYGRWKALHYMARRFFAPILLSAVEDAAGQVEIYVTSDAAIGQEGNLRWRLVTTAGDPVQEGAIRTTIVPRKSHVVATLDLKQALDDVGAHNLLLSLVLESGGQQLASNLVHWSRPKHLTLADPQIQSEVLYGEDDSFQVTLQTTKPALWVWLAPHNANMQFSDNYFHLLPDAPKTITVTTTEALDEEAFRRQLQIFSLYNTYQER